MQSIVRRPVKNSSGGSHGCHEVDRDHDRPLQPLGTVNGDYVDGVVGRVGSAFDFAFALFPKSGHVVSEDAQATNRIWLCHFKEALDVGKGPLDIAWMPLGQDGADVKLFHGRGQDVKMRGLIRLSPETLKNSDDLRRYWMIDFGG